MPPVPRKTVHLQEVLLPVLAGLNLLPQTQEAGTRIGLTLVEAAQMLDVAGCGGFWQGVGQHARQPKSFRMARLVPTDERLTA